MDSNSPVSRELEVMIPVLAETMKFAVQAVKQSTALAEVLMRKGVVTKAELDEWMSTHPETTKKLLDLLDEQIKKTS